jgi:hypothetical protein
MGRVMTTRRVRTVGTILGQLRICRPIRKSELHSGDRLLVTTDNSVYSITVLEDATYSVRGGWFDRKGLSPVVTSIAGCTWGGSVIKVDVVAAHGLRLEFGNRVVTSGIREIRVLRAGSAEGCRLRSFDVNESLQACYGPRWNAGSAA